MPSLVHIFAGGQRKLVEDVTSYGNFSKTRENEQGEGGESGGILQHDGTATISSSITTTDAAARMLGKKKVLSTTYTTSATGIDYKQQQSQSARIKMASVKNISGRKYKAKRAACDGLRGVTVRPSGNWQAQVYLGGRSFYIGIFDSREKAACAYEIARDLLKDKKKLPSSKEAERLYVEAARKVAVAGANKIDPPTETEDPTSIHVPG